MNRRRLLASLLAALPLLLTSCNIGAPPEQDIPPTLSSEDVMRTAEAIAQATRQAATATPTAPPATPTPTEIPATQTPTQTATPSSAIVIADYNANVRSGPAEAFEQIDFLLEGDAANAAGRFIHDESGVWYYITRQGQGLPGWIWSGAVTLSGNPDSIPFLESPPTPTPGPSLTPEAE